MPKRGTSESVKKLMREYVELNGVGKSFSPADIVQYVCSSNKEVNISNFVAASWLKYQDDITRVEPGKYVKTKEDPVKSTSVRTNSELLWRYVQKHPGSDVKEISKNLNLCKSTVATYLDKFCKRGAMTKVKVKSLKGMTVNTYYLPGAAEQASG